LPGLVYEQDGNVVTDRIDQPAAGAGQLVVLHPQGRLARRACQDLQQPVVDLHCHTSLSRPRTSSRTAVIVLWSAASALSLSSGSVLDARRLNHQPAPFTVSPSSSSGSPRPANASRTRRRAASWSATVLLISPEEW